MHVFYHIFLSKCSIFFPKRNIQVSFRDRYLWQTNNVKHISKIFFNELVSPLNIVFTVLKAEGKRHTFSNY